MSQSSPPLRPLTIKITTWLLFLQALALLTLGMLNLINLNLNANPTPEETIGIIFRGLTGGIIFIALACIGLTATFNFWRMDQLAWTMGMLTQGLTLLTALIIFLQGNTDIYSYTMMAYGVFMVIYLHMPDTIGTLRQAKSKQ